ncbi:MAG: ABC transporter permease [Candidatus Marinimicrobia bacterium]|nr:ABC transporter permease [Candidatus Neomarinimicrobiota bacterium]
MNGLNIWIAKRLLFAKKEIGFISWSGIFSILGLAIGCFSLIVAVAVLNGFEKEIREKVVGYEGDVKIHSVSISNEQKLEIESVLANSKEVKEFTSYIERKAIILANEKRSLIWVKAIDKMGDEVYRINYIEKSTGTSNLPQIWMGRGMAERLDLIAGDTVSLLSPLDSQLIMGFPSTAQFILTAIFQTNILDFDERTCFIPLNVGQELFKLGKKVHGIDIRLIENSNPSIFVGKLAEKILDNVNLSTWAELHKTLFAAMQMEKIGSIVVLSLIVLVASFNLTSTLIMLVMEKVREIGILKTLGATNSRIRYIFGIQGGIIGTVGLGLGLTFGLFFVLIQRHWELIRLPEHIYFLKSLPMVLPIFDVAVILVIGSLMVAVAIIYPAVIASRLLPRESIHFEK